MYKIQSVFMYWPCILWNWPSSSNLNISWTFYIEKHVTHKYTQLLFTFPISCVSVLVLTLLHFLHLLCEDEEGRGWTSLTCSRPSGKSIQSSILKTMLPTVPFHLGCQIYVCRADLVFPLVLLMSVGSIVMAPPLFLILTLHFPSYSGL